MLFQGLSGGVLLYILTNKNKSTLSPHKGQSSIQISSIAEELAKKTEDASRQQEEITHLLSQIVDLQKKAKTVRIASSFFFHFIGEWFVQYMR